MVATVVVVEFAAVVGGDVDGGLAADAVVTSNGARVADGNSSTPMTTATTTTPTPRNQPEVRVTPVARDQPRHPRPRPNRPGRRGRRSGRSSSRLMWCGGRLEPAPALVEAAAAQATDHQWGVLEGFTRVDDLRQPAVVPGWRHAQADADPRRFRSGPGPPRFLEVEDQAVLVGQCHRRVKPANALRAKQGSSAPLPQPARAGTALAVAWRQGRCGAAGSADDL